MVFKYASGIRSNRFDLHEDSSTFGLSDDPFAAHFDYSSSDEGDSDRGDRTWVPSGPAEGFDMSTKT